MVQKQTCLIFSRHPFLVYHQRHVFGIHSKTEDNEGADKRMILLFGSGDNRVLPAAKLAIFLQYPKITWKFIETAKILMRSVTIMTRFLTSREDVIALLF